MGCNCGNRRNLGAVSSEHAAMQEANRKAQANAEALIAAQATVVDERHAVESETAKAS